MAGSHPSKGEPLDISRVAELARLRLSPAELAEFERQLSQIVHHFRRLETVDVSDIEPTAHAFPLQNVWAEDVPEPGLKVEEALRNAPASQDDMISVPKVVEE